MKYLITGGCGFLGSNLAHEVLKRNEQLVVFDNLYRNHTEKNLAWLQTLGKFEYYRSDIRNFDDVSYVIKKEKPDVVFHVAGQVAMTTSLDRPRLDFEINALGSHNLLESVRLHSPKTKIVYSSTNKVYGDLEYLKYNESSTRYLTPEFPRGFAENINLDFRTPYGCSKGAADQYMKDYYKCFGVETVTFRHSSIYGGRQFSTFDQGWIGWFVEKALAQKNNLEKSFTIAGSGKQVRDVLYSSDLIDCYFQAVENINQTKGESFNIGGGFDNSLSLLELFQLLEKKLSIKMNFEKLAPRESDQKVFIADIAKAKQKFKWEPKITKDQGIDRMIDWVGSIKKG
jgi:CDP-paratose 2-epimerase